jgi:hypothetical protein
MRCCGVMPLNVFWRLALGTILATTAFNSLYAQDKPTGAPLVLSSTETEQEIPLAILLPDGKTAKCVPIRLHWTSQPAGPNDEATSFTLDLPADNPAAPIFTAQLWNASLASALAWQEPWEGARWKVLQTAVTDGSGIDAALAVGMIATSARRPYPSKTVVIGSLNPDGSLGPVSHHSEYPAVRHGLDGPSRQHGETCQRSSSRMYPGGRSRHRDRDDDERSTARHGGA